MVIIARNGGDGEKGIVGFEFGVLIFEIRFGGELHLTEFSFGDSVETVAM